MMDLCFEHRGTNLDWQTMETPVNVADGGSASVDAASSRVLMTVTLPLAEIVTDFFDKLKSRSSGFASFECVSLSLSSFWLVVSQGGRADPADRSRFLPRGLHPVCGGCVGCVGLNFAYGLDGG